MKKNFIYLPALALAFLFTACKKDTNNTQATVKGSFVLDGTTFTETTGTFATASLGTSGNFESLGVYGTNGSKKGELIFFFAGTGKPAAGTYTVTSDLTQGSTGAVGILASDSLSVAKEGLFSAKNGSSITVSVNGSGKVSISMPATSFTGSNYDNTDPKNTVITDATVSGSGTLVEQ
jgi:hypothetical protein